jgi:uncharacterized membrane protein (Fun14 family)
MPIENIESIATSVGLGGITGFLLGYFMRKIIKIILFAVGGIPALLMYLQYQGLITVNMAIPIRNTLGIKLQGFIAAFKSFIISFQSVKN